MDVQYMQKQMGLSQRYCFKKVLEAIVTPVAEKHKVYIAKSTTSNIWINVFLEPKEHINDKEDLIKDLKEALEKRFEVVKIKEVVTESCKTIRFEICGLQFDVDFYVDHSTSCRIIPDDSEAITVTNTYGRKFHLRCAGDPEKEGGEA